MAANSVNKAILACAWPYNSKKAKYTYPTGGPYSLFKRALLIAYPSTLDWSAAAARGATAAVFAGTLMRYTKADRFFPKSLSEQINYIKTSKNFDKIGTNTVKNKLKGGDLLVSKDNIRLIVEKDGKLYVAHASLKNKYFGRLVKQAPTKSAGYTTYRAKAKNTSYNNLSSSLAASEDRNYIKLTVNFFEQIKTYVSKNKFTDILTSVQNILPQISLNLSYTELDNLAYKPLINTCERVVSNILTSEATSLKNASDTLEALLSSEEVDEERIKKLMEIIEKQTNNTRDVSQIEEYIYLLKLRSLALRMLADHEKSRDSLFYTTTYFNDLTNKDGILYEITHRYEENEIEYKKLLNENYEKLNYLTTENYTNKINLYNQELNKINVKINNLKQAIKDKASDYFTVQDEIDKINDIIDEIQLRITLLEKDNFSDEYAYWNKNVILNPGVLNFWLEFLDTSGELSQFNIRLIGDRSKTVNDTNATSIYFREIPQIIYVAPDETHDVSSFTGYTAVNIDSGLDSLFTLSALKKSVKDVIDENLYNHAYCAEEINVTAIPIYYLKPGIITSIYDKNSTINGNYVINTISLPLTYNGNMTLTASKMPTRLY